MQCTIINVQVDQVAEWALATIGGLRQAPGAMTRSENGIHLRVVDVRSHIPLHIVASADQGRLHLRVLTNDMEMAGDILQDLAGRHLGQDELTSQLNFPSTSQMVQEI